MQRKNAGPGATSQDKVALSLSAAKWVDWKECAAGGPSAAAAACCFCLLPALFRLCLRVSPGANAQLSETVRPPRASSHSNTKSHNTQVLEVVYYAQKAVLHPVAPLYDTVRHHPLLPRTQSVP